MKRWRSRGGWVVGVLLASGFWSMVSAAEIAVVVGQSYPIHQIQRDDLKRIYMGEKSREGSMAIKPVDQADSAPIKKKWLEEVLGSTPDHYRGYWMKQIFRREGIPPIVKSSSREVMDSVASEKGTIGYIWAEEAAGYPDLRILLKIEVGDWEQDSNDRASLKVESTK